MSILFFDRVSLFGLKQLNMYLKVLRILSSARKLKVFDAVKMKPPKIHYILLTLSEHGRRFETQGSKGHYHKIENTAPKPVYSANHVQPL